RITRPSLSLSRRPAQKKRSRASSGGNRLKIVSGLCGSSFEQISPRGLLTASVIFGCGRARTDRPWTVTLSTPGTIFWPVSAWRQFTKTSPTEIRASAARREHTPLSARNFWSRMGSGDEADMGRRTEDGRRRTEDGRRRSEDGRQKTED